MKVAIEKKKLDDMYSNICEKTERLSDLIDGYIHNDELESYMYMLLNDIKFSVKEVYNPELVELKSQLGHLRHKLQLNEDTSLFCEYERIKQKISEIENPF